MKRNNNKKKKNPKNQILLSLDQANFFLMVKTAVIKSIEAYTHLFSNFIILATVLSESGCRLSTANANSLQAKLVQLDCFSTVKSKERVRFPGFALSGTKSVQISVKTQKALAPNCNHLLRYCLRFNSDVLHSNQEGKTESRTKWSLSLRSHNLVYDSTLYLS